jgi:hypothetical protein
LTGTRSPCPCVRAAAARIGSGPFGARIASSGSVRTGIGQNSGAAAAAGEFGVDVVSREVGVSMGTLERWRVEALANGPGGGSQRWTAAARLQAVIATAAMDEATCTSLAPCHPAWSRDTAAWR